MCIRDRCHAPGLPTEPCFRLRKRHDSTQGRAAHTTLSGTARPTSEERLNQPVQNGSIVAGSALEHAFMVAAQTFVKRAVCQRFAVVHCMAVATRDSFMLGNAVRIMGVAGIAFFVGKHDFGSGFYERLPLSLIHIWEAAAILRRSEEDGGGA